MFQSRRGEQLDQTYIDDSRLMFKAIFPLSEVIVDFFDELKSLTSGYGRLVHIPELSHESCVLSLEYKNNCNCM